MIYHKKPATYVGKVQLRTEDLERALRFYQETLGFKVLEQSSSRAQLSADGNTTILSLVQPENVIPRQEKKAGLYHFALLLPQRSDLAHMVSHLVGQDIRFGASDHLVSEAIYFNDPDGNGIEIYADRDPSTWQWNEDGVSMTTKPLDFDDLLASASLGQPWMGLPAKTIIGHIHLHVSELQDTELFYTQGLGFDIVTKFRDSALFLSTNHYHHHIALNTWSGVGAPQTPKNSVGLDFYTLVFPDEQSRQQVMNNLQNLGTTIDEVNGRVTVADPSGNRIQLL